VYRGALRVSVFEDAARDLAGMGLHLRPGVELGRCGVALSTLTDVEERTPTSRSAAGDWFQRRRRLVWDGARPHLRSSIPVYVAAHGLVMIVALLILNHHGRGPLTALSWWDGDWYRKIADHGYEHHILYDKHGVLEQMKIAFFPLFPWLMRLVGHTLGISSVAAGVIISAVAALFAAAGIHVLLEPAIGRRPSLIAVALYGTLLPSFVQSAVYTESLFTALSVWALVACVRKQWLTAGILSVFTGLTRSTAFILVGTVCLFALIEGVRKRDWRALTAVLIAPMGFAGYFVFLRIRIGRWDAWSLSETAPDWNHKFDFGKSFFSYLARIGTLSIWPDPATFGYVLVMVPIIIALAGLVYLARERRLPAPVYFYTVLGTVFTVLSGGNYSSLGRYLMPYFALVVPLAGLLSKARLSSLLVFFAVTAYIAGWYGAWFFLGVPGTLPP